MGERFYNSQPQYNYICNVSYLFSERWSRLGFPSSLVSYMGGKGVVVAWEEGHLDVIMTILFACAMTRIFPFVSLSNSDHGLPVGLFM